MLQRRAGAATTTMAIQRAAILSGRAVDAKERRFEKVGTLCLKLAPDTVSPGSLPYPVRLLHHLGVSGNVPLMTQL